MILSAPIYRLKQRAKDLKRREQIPLNEALNRIAREEGFSSWSLLAARAATNTPSRQLLTRLRPGDLLLLGARPGQGKTMMGIELIADAIKTGRRGYFFTLEYNEADVLSHLRTLGEESALFADQFTFDNFDEICADYIIERLVSAPRGSIVVIDYLQLLDQKRDNPELAHQIRALKMFAKTQGLIITFISQIHRSYDPGAKPCPDLTDVRLPNPLDLSLFNKTCFLNNGEVRIETVT